MPGPAGFKRNLHRPIIDPVNIDLPLRVKARMKIRGSDGTFHDPDSPWQMRIESRRPILIARRRDIHMSNLPKSVHSGISAPGAMHHDPAPTKLKQGGFQMILHSIPAHLALPPQKGRPVVSDKQFESNESGGVQASSLSRFQLQSEPRSCMGG